MKAGHLPLETVRSMAARICARWSSCYYCPAPAEVAAAAALAAAGQLRGVRCLRLGNLDLAAVEAEQLASLASTVTECVMLHNLAGDLHTLLSNLRCGAIFNVLSIALLLVLNAY